MQRKRLPFAKRLFIIYKIGGKESEEHYQHIGPVGYHTGGYAAYGMRHYRLGRKLSVAQRVEHGGVRAEVSAPAHADGGEHGYGVAVNPSGAHEAGYEAERGAHGAEGCYGECHLVRVVEAEEPLEQEAYLVGKPWQKLDALVRRAVVARRSGTEGEHHDKRRDYKDAGNYGYADVDAGASAVEQGVKRAQEYAFLFFLLFLLLNLVPVADRLVGVLRIHFEYLALHEARGNYAAYEGSKESYYRLDVEALPYHEHHDEQSHAEGGAEIGERNELVFLEVAAETLVLRQRDDGGIVRQECHHGSERGHSGQVEQRAHERAEQLLEQADDTELDEEAAYGARDDADAHKVEHGVEQQVVGGFHNSVEHVGHAHD